MHQEDKIMLERAKYPPYKFLVTSHSCSSGSYCLFITALLRSFHEK